MDGIKKSSWRRRKLIYERSFYSSFPLCASVADFFLLILRSEALVFVNAALRASSEYTVGESRCACFYRIIVCKTQRRRSNSVNIFSFPLALPRSLSRTWWSLRCMCVSLHNHRVTLQTRTKAPKQFAKSETQQQPCKNNCVRKWARANATGPKMASTHTHMRPYSLALVHIQMI